MMDPTIRKAQYAYSDAALKRAQESWKAYAALPRTGEEETLWKEFVPRWERWRTGHQKVVSLSLEKDRLFAGGVALSDQRIAAIEAARAGEHGRGGAMVADLPHRPGGAHHQGDGGDRRDDQGHPE
jgi:hypothetical protein